MLKWREGYLSHRTQYVVFDGEKSDTDSIKCGVSQEYIIVPLLFILSVNDICNVSPLLFKILFADNTCVLLSGKNLNTLSDFMNIDFSSLNNWLKAIKLSLNTISTCSNGFLPEVFNALDIKKIAKFILIVLEVKICIIFYLEHKHFQTSVLKFKIL